MFLLVCVTAARGTLRSGPPLRWGDAYTTDSMFANHLGLNGTLTLTNTGSLPAAFSLTEVSSSNGFAGSNLTLTITDPALAAVGLTERVAELTADEQATLRAATDLLQRIAAR